MAERDRIRDLVRQFASPASPGSGNRRSLPVLSPADAGGMARALHREMDRVSAERERFADQKGLDIACRRGCSDCCRTVVVVYLPEAIAVAQWLSRPSNRDAKEAFLARYPEWNRAVGREVDRLEELHGRQDHQAAEALHKELQGRAIMCPFNRDGDCSVYPARPNACRYLAALDTSEFCHPQNPAGHGPTLMGFEPADQCVSSALGVLRRAHGQISDTEQPATALCRAVYRALQRPDRLSHDAGSTRVQSQEKTSKVGRNEPCPCGSGKKFKRCCGR